MANTIREKNIFNAECTLLGSFLFSNTGKRYFEENKIKEQIFTSNNINQTIIKNMNKLLEIGSDYNEEILAQQLVDDLKVEKNKILEYFDKLKENKTDDINTIKTFLSILIKEYKIKRYLKLIDDLKELALRERNNPTNTKLDSFESKYLRMFEEITEEFPEQERKEFNMAQGINFLYKTLRKNVETGKKETISAGYREVNRLYNGGHVKGTYTIIAARPGMGKTVYMINEAIESALDGERVLFISIEMTMIQIFQRIIAKLTNIEAKKFMSPELLTASEWERFKQVAEEVVEIFSNNFWVVEVSSLKISEARSIIRKYKKNYDVDSVYIDYAQIMTMENGEPPEKESDYASISRGLAKIAKDEYIHITVGSQLKREVEERQNKRPIQSDLRNSGAFEQDAARIAALYRDDVYYGEESEEPNVLEYISLKDRFGQGRGAATSTIKFKIDVKKQSIYSSYTT